ncbi:hypothetical protein GYA19_01335, partial [Candidatus Beckwithbacteria bacterium]|nr:hypothetical protein [Candidatus Beckwithbacteria bacterium]
PLAYFLAEIFILLGFSILLSLKITYILISIFGFWGMYFLAKKITNQWGGLLASVAFTFAPYHALNLYVRGALAEYLAIAFFPWVFYFTLELLAKNTKTNYLGLTLSLTGLLLAHNISVVTFMAFWGLLSLFLLIAKKQYKSVFILLLSFINAFLLAAFFLVPAFLQQNFTRVKTLTEGFSNFAYHFVYLRQLFIPNWGYGGSIEGLEDDISFYLGNELLIIAALAFLLLLFNVFVKKRLKLKLVNFLFFAFLFLLSLFLLSFKSKFIWDKLTILSFIQFPWRFLGIASFILSLLVAFIALLKAKYRWLVFIFAVMIMFLNQPYFTPNKLGDSTIAEDYDPSADYIREKISLIIPDYLPQELDMGKIGPTSQNFRIVDGDFDIETLKDKTQKLLLKIEATTSGKLQINRYVFPNWHIKLDNKEINCEIKNSVYICPIEEGEHILDFYWDEKGVNQIANYLSMLGILLVVFFYLRWDNGKSNE